VKFLIAPDSFKESMTASVAAHTIARGIKACLPEAITLELPLADGGEGTMDILVNALDGRKQQYQVTGPLFEPVKASVGLIQGNTAIIEIAEAAGLHLVPVSQRNPEQTTTFGVGELIRLMLDQNVRRFLVALGGSATNDGGLGLLVALGAKIYDKSGQKLPPIGQSLGLVASLDISALDQRLKACSFMVACDVTHPLIGPEGASAVFGPQKGATPEQVILLDQGMSHWAKQLDRLSLDPFSVRGMSSSIETLPGGGAAGGLGAVFHTVFKASLKPGIDQVLKSVHFDSLCKDADWVITGEGAIDGQSLAGKTPVGVAKRAKHFGVPVIAFAGKLGEGYEGVYNEGVDTILCITPEGMPLEEALEQAEQHLYDSTIQVVRKLMV